MLVPRSSHPLYHPGVAPIIAQGLITWQGFRAAFVLSSLPSKQEKTPGSPILRAIRVPPDGMVQAEWVRQNTQLSISSGRCSHLPPWLDSHDRDHVRANCVPIRRLEKPHRNCFVVQGLYRYTRIIRREIQESMGKLSDFYQKFLGRNKDWLSLQDANRWPCSMVLVPARRSGAFSSTQKGALIVSIW